ncbi:hypothetical protein DYI37_03085 [Fulvimarina endophytica]|uniref:Uncharacterized protein n=1 Tax=Fulvimarina endophytica TaxID=2293836 RepID=A0A371XB74_9HYPH|nr:hypothetical protein [Fulvimarina endophytica]RFC66442.1 hypothetical protein DYI37_03085 [Fulvimarina endophytica]
MGLAYWPENELPRPQQDGYQNAIGDPRRVTPPDAGPPRVRRRLSRVADTIRMSFMLTHTQRARLLAFWYDDTVSGTSVFIVPDWEMHGVPLADENGNVILIAPNRPLLISAYHHALFGTPPSITPLGGQYWNASIEISKLP